MKIRLSLFFRHPGPIYFSLEKIFRTIGAGISKSSPDLDVVDQVLPFPSKLKTIRPNIRFVRRHQTGINHFTGDAQYAILGCSSQHINILTVHDCVLLHQYPASSLRHQLIRWLWYRLPARKADAVTVISENTRQDMLRFTNCAPEKIHLIPNFLDPSYRPVARRPLPALPKLLFIGTAPNKNLHRLAEALEGIPAELLIVGYPSPDLLRLMKEKKIQHSCRSHLSAADMRNVYAECDLLVFPSLLEGFGLPIIEAQATGRPVLTSNIEPMLSVAGKGADYVDPLNVQSIREGIRRILGDDGYRDSLVAEGLENVKRFEADEIIKKYHELYRALLKKKPQQA